MSAIKSVTLSRSAASTSDRKEHKEPKHPATQAAVRALSHDIARQLGPIYGATHISLSEKADYLERMLHLEEFDVGRPQETPSIKLFLSPHHWALFKSILQASPVKSNINVLELWGVDLYTHLKALTTKLPPVHIGSLKAHMKQFCVCFAQGSVAILAKIRQNFELPMEPKQWAGQLDAFTKRMQTEFAEPISKNKELQKLFEAVQLRCNLGEELLQKNKPERLRTGLGSLLIKDFVPGEEQGPDKRLAFLMRHAQLLAEGFPLQQESMPAQFAPCIFADIYAHLAKMSQEEDRCAPFLALKERLSAHFRAFGKADQYFKSAIDLIKNRQQAVTANTNFVQNRLLNLHAHFCLHALDVQIMAPLYPDTHVATHLGFRRLGINLESFFRDALKEPVTEAQKGSFLPPCDISQSQREALDLLIAGVQSDLATLSKSKLPPVFFEKGLSILRALPGSVVYDLWLPFIDDFAILLRYFETLPAELGGLRKKHLQQIGAFCKTLPAKELGIKREEWIEFFRQACLRESLPFCKLNVVVQDLKACTKLCAASEEDLLSDEYLDYALLDGIEMVIDSLMPEPEPPDGSSGDAASKPTPRFPPSRELTSREAPSAEEFRIRRGEKARQVWKRLHALGYSLESTRSSHHKMAHGSKKATLAFHSGGDTLKAGTASGLARQVRGEKKA